MRFQKFLRAALVLAAGFFLCVFDHFGIGMPLIMIGLFMFCLVPSASECKQKSSSTGNVGMNSAKRHFSEPKNYPPVPNAPAADAYAYRGSVERYFSELLNGCFPAFTIRENVESVSMGCPSGAMSWECKCGTANTGKFCSECGRRRPAASVRNSAGTGTANLSFVLYQNGTPVAAVILCGKHEWDNQQITGAMNACRNANIPCLRFMKEFRNSAGYVVERINSVLR